jgi:hypothetical protein
VVVSRSFADPSLALVAVSHCYSSEGAGLVAVVVEAGMLAAVGEVACQPYVAEEVDSQDTVVEAAAVLEEERLVASWLVRRPAQESLDRQGS